MVFFLVTSCNPASGPRVGELYLFLAYHGRGRLKEGLKIGF